MSDHVKALFAGRSRWLEWAWPRYGRSVHRRGRGVVAAGEGDQLVTERPEHVDVFFAGLPHVEDNGLFHGQVHQGDGEHPGVPLDGYFLVPFKAYEPQRQGQQQRDVHRLLLAGGDLLGADHLHRLLQRAQTLLNRLFRHLKTLRCRAGGRVNRVDGGGQ